jgi:RNA polymerase sigma factor (sigma-70 family)
VELDEIVNRLREGHTQEFTRLADRYRDMAFGYALTLLDQEQMAEDVVQEALLIAYTHLDRLRQPRAFGAWLRGIVRHQCARARAGVRRSNVANVEWEQLDAADGAAADPAEEAVNAVVRQEVRLAVEELPQAQREIVQLHYETGLSQREIAARLGLTVPAVNMRLHAARTRLRRRLQIMIDTPHEMGNTGRVQAASGPVITLQFAPGAVPPLFSRLTADGKEELCVVQQLSAGRVLAVATRAAAIWTPGQEILNAGQPFTASLDLATVRNVIDVLRSAASTSASSVSTSISISMDAGPLPSGIKTIEAFAPLTNGGSTGVFTEWGLGVLVLLPELLRNLDREDNRQTLFVLLPSIRDVTHWQEVNAEITTGNRNIAIVYLPVADPLSQELMDGLSNLDTTLVLARRLAEQAIWPCLDPLMCRSRLLEGMGANSEQANVATGIRQLLRNYYRLQFSLDAEAHRMLSPEERQQVVRARLALRFLSQPFFVAEPYTRRPGAYVTPEEAIRGFADILAGRYDTAPRDEFYMIGAAPAMIN